MKAACCALLLALATTVWAQSDPVGDDYAVAVQEGQSATASDDDAVRLQELVGEAEESGAYEDGEYELLEDLAPASPGYSDE